MTGPDEENRQVGYKKPPVEHRFKKGTSGNPRGRPRKKKLSVPGVNDVAAQPANALLLQEAYRPVVVREGEKIERLPGIQAVYRALHVSAIKGNRHAQKLLTDLVREVEEADRKEKEALFQAMVRYKVDGEHIIARAQASGAKPPEMLPHPDDVIIDLKQGVGQICGPSTKEEKLEWDGIIARLISLQEDVSHSAQLFKRARSAEKKEQYLRSWIFNQGLYDRLNDNLPRRYRRELEDRCWQPGASLPGAQRRASWLGG